MDGRLVAWARAVKARRRGPARGVPPLWLFTDAVRLPDPCPAIAGLPLGLCGVVFRHDGVPGRAALARAVRTLCRRRRAVMVVAGDARLARALGVGVHLRGGRVVGAGLRRGMVTSSAHDGRELHRAVRAGARAVFISPVFPTASHPGARGLGVLRWTRLARAAPHACAALALGGVNGDTVRLLPRQYCDGAGTVSALRTSAKAAADPRP